MGEISISPPNIDIQMKKALLIVNLGTPDKPARKEVGTYLSAFLNDPFVIDIPWLWRNLLVNLIIVPFRTKKSTALYRKLWSAENKTEQMRNPKGANQTSGMNMDSVTSISDGNAPSAKNQDSKMDSPLRRYLYSLKDKLSVSLEGEYEVFVAMRYGNPSLKKVLKEIVAGKFDELVVLPLFPQYATSTTETIRQYILRNLTKNSFYTALNFDAAADTVLNFPAQAGLPSIRFVEQFYDHPAYLQAMAARVAEYKPEDYDKVLFSFHSLPESQVEQFHPSYKAEGCICEQLMPEYGSRCYKAVSYETVRQIAGLLNLPASKFRIGFQSRFAKNWVGPFSDQIVVDEAEKGTRKLLVVAPSFVADCLETTVEIGMDYQELFQKHGGTTLTMVPALNDDPSWVAAIREIIR